jgi:thioredoxin 1
MKKSSLAAYIIGTIVLAAVIVVIAVKPSEQTSSQPQAPEQVIRAEFSCSGGKTIQASFNNDTSTVTLRLSDDRDITLPQAISASGARYANEDESFVFWNKGNTAFIQENGTNTYEDCVTEENASGAGTYEQYAPEKLSRAETGDVVLFFHANWCPICRALEQDITADLSRIPANTHILKVDYDTATELRQKYGVTVQHTFVQVDAQGNAVAKWIDATNLPEVLARIR